ncbi:xylulokinase [Sneathiella marina]|uniref:Xylulose kinase n=1 Tax=Sneathiella marina TaxID=2950108 RepID=A0ABY4W275_9PROT|nr:xylulokinase [Sneathiella marina]USG61044.1 xylulokinase [Sneathiella marina]
MYLGLDLGTSGLRGLLVSDDGYAVGEASANYGVQHQQTGWSEQDPQDWINACQSVMDSLRASYANEYKRLRGIGISGHMHGAVCLDEAGKVIRHCILWNDTRAAKEALELDMQPKFRALSGNIVFPGFTAPKLLWMARHEPNNFARVAKVLLPKDYLVYWLTGELTSEMSDAAGTSWLDVGKRDWSRALIDGSGMRPDQMPKVIEGSDIVGEVRGEIIADLSLPANITVVAGAGDNAAAACGIGAFREGQGFVSLGTSGVLLAAKDNYAPEPASAVHTFCHAVSGKWYQMGVILSATDSLNWLAETMGKTAQDLAKNLPDRVAGPADVRFLPYLSGERTPHNDAVARGAFIGLSKASNADILCQSVMEGVGFALRDCLEALKSTGTELPSVIAIGGGSSSHFWLQTLSNILNIPLHLPVKGDFGAALGAARLAMLGIGGRPSAEVMVPPIIERSFEPDPNYNAAYDTAYYKYTKSYIALKELM